MYMNVDDDVDMKWTRVTLIMVIVTAIPLVLTFSVTFCKGSSICKCFLGRVSSYLKTNLVHKIYFEINFAEDPNLCYLSAKMMPPSRQNNIYLWKIATKLEMFCKATQHETDTVHW